MMNGTLLKRELKYNTKILLLFCGILTLYTAMIISMFDPKLGDSLKAMKESMPQIFAAVGMANQGDTLLDFIINYLFGFLYKVLPLVFFLILVSRVLIRYIDRGTMAYLLSTPNSRGKIARTQAGVILLELIFLLLYITVLGIGVSEGLFRGKLDIPAFLLLMAALFGLLMFLSGICFLSGCIFNDSGKALGVGAGLNILFLLIQMASQVGDKFEKLKYINPLTLFDPYGIAARDEESILMFLALYAGGILLYSAGILIFSRKDLPV
jgi:ABC-2 type transport system permease protein